MTGYSHVNIDFSLYVPNSKYIIILSSNNHILQRHLFIVYVWNILFFIYYKVRSTETVLSLCGHFQIGLFIIFIPV